MKKRWKFNCQRFLIVADFNKDDILDDNMQYLFIYLFYDVPYMLTWGWPLALHQRVNIWALMVYKDGLITSC